MCGFLLGKPSYLHDSTHPDWAPSLKLAGETGQTGKDERATDFTSRKRCAMARYNRVQQRRTQASSSGSVAQEQDSPGMNTTEAYNDVMDAFETVEEDMCTSKVCSKIQADHQRLLTDNITLKSQLATEKISMDTLRDDEKKVRFYTGLSSFATLMVLYNFIEGSLTDSFKTSLTKFQKLVLVLMRLRHNFPEQDLAYRFGISVYRVQNFCLCHACFVCET